MSEKKVEKGKKNCPICSKDHNEHTKYCRNKCCEQTYMKTKVTSKKGESTKVISKKCHHNVEYGKGQNKIVLPVHIAIEKELYKDHKVEIV